MDGRGGKRMAKEDGGKRYHTKGERPQWSVPVLWQGGPAGWHCWSCRGLAGGQGLGGRGSWGLVGGIVRCGTLKLQQIGGQSQVTPGGKMAGLTNLHSNIGATPHISPFCCI